MALNSSTPTGIINSGYNSFRLVGLSQRSEYAQAWADGYEAYAATGTNPIAEVAGPGDVIGNAILSFDGYDSENVDILAQAMASYWSGSHLIPKGAAVAIVGNDAMSKVGDFKDALLSSVTNKPKSPPFKHLFDICEPIVKSIIWTGTTSNGSTVYGTIA